MERDLFQQIWPIFSAEAREHLATIGGGILDLEREPGRTATLDAVRRTAHSLKGSAGSLGLGDVETLAHAIEGSLAGFDAAEGLSRAVVQAALDAVEAMEEAIATGDGGGEPRVTAVEALVSALAAVPGAVVRSPTASTTASASTTPAAAVAAASPAATPRKGAIDLLEGAVEKLCAPLDAEARRAIAEEAAASARAIAESAHGVAGELARRVALAFAHLGEGGPDTARAAATTAGDLVALRDALERAAGPAAAAAPASATATPTAQDRSIRVLASTLESLARQLELLSLAEARHARRARDVLGLEAALRDVVRDVDGALRANATGGATDALRAASGRLRGVAGELGRVGRDAGRDADAQRLAATVLREDLRALRLVPAALLLEPLRRTVRDVAGRLGKDAELVVTGADVKLDRRIVDELRDALVHLVRNAVDHGLEGPDARRAAGKPARGQVSVRVEPRGSRVGIVVEDDGRGLDLAAIRAAAVRKGTLAAGDAASLPDAEVARFVFRAGLSTARAVTEVSGRGVGLDAVQEALARLRGEVDVGFEPGRGTRFDLEVPLTLAATPAVLFRLGRDVAALPADAVERVLLVAASDVGTVAGRTTVDGGGEQIPFAPLATLLGVSAGEPQGKHWPALVLESGGRRVAVGVDDVVGQQELVVTALGARVASVAHLAGAALLDDGRVVGVLSAAEVFRRARPADGAARAAAPRRVRIVVADDSLTTRSAMKALLEIAGFTVLPAADGEEALALLREGGAELVVSDVQMPGLDGLGLARRMKADPRLRATPVILVTSLDAPEDRAAGLEAGADGYLVKREVERGKLLELVRQLLPDRA